MDFITKLLLLKVPDGIGTKYNSIWVIVNRLIKWAYFLLWKETTIVEQFAYLFERHVASQYGLPDEIISNRDKLFTLKFWQAFMIRIDIKSKFLTAHYL